MFPRILAAAILCTAVCPMQAQQRPVVAAGAQLFRLNPTCVCIKTRSNTATLQSVKIVEGKPGNRTTYQSFRLRSEPDVEVFRVEVEWETEGETNGWWNYGIANEGDFNADGQPDYTWYGGDDTGSTMLLFLSTPYGYVRVDVLKSIGTGWEKRFHQPAPDFSEAESSEWSVEEVHIKRQDEGVELIAVLRDKPDGAAKPQPEIRLEIPEAEFAH
jgi:hypothetical protein